MRSLTVDCCVAGGGPAGIMAGLLFARAGCRTIVLEKHADFLRDFRGDTVHPSTLENMKELGLLEGFLERPHQRLEKLSGVFGSEKLTIAEFSRLDAACKFIAFMPQWHFLDFLSDAAKSMPTFSVEMEAEVMDLILDGERVAGVRADTKQGPLEVRATLTIGADGRGSVVREKAGLKVQDIGAPIDVLWFGVPRDPGERDEPLLNAGPVISSYRSIAAITINAHSSFPREKLRKSSRAACRSFATPLVGPRRNWRTGSARLHRSMTSSC
jgi:2-polyprenyl-6-methoxyphenol hydroxylase-like FAD-dependent oxidoreductase